MSISPNKDQSSSSSSITYSSSNHNPNHPNHGSLNSQNHNQPPSTPIPHNHYPPHFSNSSGLPARASGTTASSSKKMNNISESSGQKVIARPYTGRDSQRGGGITRYREKARPEAETVALPDHTLQISSGPSNGKPSTAHGPGKKNQMVSANHLLNFHYDPIQVPKSRAHNPPPQRRQHKRKPYNKDLFLQANYRFVLLDSGANSLETIDPDKMLIWEDIVCVKYATPCHVQCPICLEDPLCPQITSCGHIFCFPCILRYFLNSEEDHKGEIWKKCPLCFVMIPSKDLYTIYIENVKQHSVGDTAEFMLLTRQKDSCVLSLKQNKNLGIENGSPDSFSKFIFTSDADLSVRDAVSELDSWLAKADSGLVDDLEKLPYVCAAMEQLEQRRNYWNKRRLDHENTSQKHSRAHPENANDVEAHSKIGKSMRDLSISSNCDVKLKMVVDETLSDQHVDVLKPFEGGESRVLQTNIDGPGDRKEKDSYNFYQAVDGQHLILHPLNLKCLLHHYGGYDMLPHRISGKILQLETVTQSETMRRRYRFLSHFSLTTTFQLCEIDLAECLPLDALSPFMDEIKNRENQRKRLAKKERQEKIKADAALANEMLATLPFKNIPFCSVENAPNFSLDDFAALGGGSPAMSSSPPMTTATGGEKMHFASVARLGFAAGYDSPSLRTESSTPSKFKPEPTSRDSSGATIGGAVLKNGGGTPSFANVISRSKDDNNQKKVESPKLNEPAKKGKKASRVLLSTSGGRRY